MFLAAHPSWSQHDLDTADQDIVDRLQLISHEQAVHTKREADRAERERKAAMQRARLPRR